MSSFKSMENIQNKEYGPDRSVSDNQSSSLTLNELAMKARRFQEKDMSCSKLSNYICHHCGSSYETAAGLRKHRVSQHEKEKMRITCVECDCRFMTNADLTAHRIDKHGSESFACEVCGKMFSRKTNLTRHQRVHCDAVPDFKCLSCGASFGRKDSLDDHMEAVHALLHKYKCDVCGSEYKYRGSLSKHKARKHSN